MSETQSIPQEDATLSSVKVYVGSEPSTDSAPMSQESVLNSKNVRGKRLRSAGKTSRPPSFFKGLFALHLLFFVALMVAGSKILAARKADLRPEVPKGVTEEEPESAHAPEVFAAEKRLAKTRVRLGKVKKLLPAAYRLASAVDTEASWKLLRRVQVAVKEARKQAERAKGGSIIEASLSKALTALNGLHKAAFQRAEELVEAAKSPLSSPPLSQWDRRFFGLLAQLEEETDPRVMDVLLKTYKAFEESAATLAQQQHHEGERIIRSSQVFKDENDKNLLLSTAKALEYLRETAKSRRRLITAANRLSETIFSGFKGVLLENCNEFVWEAESVLEAVELYAALWKPKLPHNISEGTLLVLAKNPAVQHLQDEISNAHSFLKKLLSLRHSMLESTTMAGVCTAYSKASGIKKKAFFSIQKCLLHAEFLPSCREELDTNGINLLTEKGKEVVRCLALDSAVVSEAMEELRDAAAELSQGVDEGATPFFSKALIKEHLS